MRMPRYKKPSYFPNKGVARHYSKAVLLSVLSAALLWSAAGGAQTSAQVPPPASQIRDQLIANFLSDQQALQGYVHSEHVITEKDGAREGHTLRVWYVNGREVSETTAFDQRPLTAEERASGHEAALKRAAEAAQRPPAKAGMLVFGGQEYPFSKLANDFVYGAPAVRTWNGRTIWVYPATPNPHAQGRSRQETLLLHTAGEVWVDAADLHVMRITIHLTAPVKYGFGVIATIHSAALNLTMDRHGPGQWLPQTTDFKVKATVLLLKTISRAKQSTYFDYHEAEAGHPG